MAYPNSIKQFTTKIDKNASGYLVGPEYFNVPSSAPYDVYLDHVPKDSPSTTIGASGGANWTEVFVTPTSANHYLIDYSNGKTTFHSGNASAPVQATYQNLGDDIMATHMNEVQVEIVSIEEELGPNIKRSFANLDGRLNSITASVTASGINGDNIIDNTVRAGALMDDIKGAAWVSQGRPTLAGNATAIGDHESLTAGAHPATAITAVPAGSGTITNVQQHINSHGGGIPSDFNPHGMSYSDIWNTGDIWVGGTITGGSLVKGGDLAGNNIYASGSIQADASGLRDIGTAQVAFNEIHVRTIWADTAYITYGAGGGGGGGTGTSGYSGKSGYSGYSGYSGMGWSGYSGYSSDSGYSGPSGYSGISGYSGTSGYSGESGYSGTIGPSGTSGYSGESGYSGYSSFSGYSGYSSDSGYSGYSSFSGYSGYSGYSGISGYSGDSGWSGNAGTIGGAFYFYRTAASDIATYQKLTTAVGVGAETTMVGTANNNQVLILAFATDPGDPGVTVIQSGMWYFHHWVSVANTGSVSNVVIEVYKRTYPGGVETLLFTTTSPQLISTAITEYQWWDAQPSFSINATDRLVYKVYAKTTRVGNTNITITYLGKSRYSYSTTTVSPVGYSGYSGVSGYSGGSGYSGIDGSSWRKWILECQDTLGGLVIADTQGCLVTAVFRD